MPRPRQRQRTRSTPLYDARFEHDACGVGFVADAGGRSRERVLPLALAGLAALGHRGAFAADGASSDGAGVSLPLEDSVLARLAGSDHGRPGVVVLFAPRTRRALAMSRAIVADALAAEGLTVAGWRDVPIRPTALGAVAAASRPTIVQAIVRRPDAVSDSRFEAALVIARRRAETAARSAGLDDFAVPSASSRLVVYKGLVAGDRLADLYPDLEPPLPVRHALFHQRYATNTRPEWRLAQPFRFIAHNGEINTVRGNREQLRGRAGDPSPRAIGRRLVEAGPLLTPGASDSLSLDEAIELLILTGWTIEEALLALLPEAGAVRRDPHPLARAFGRRVAGFLAPWDGPAAIVFSDGRRVGAILDRNGLRPAAFAVTSDDIVALASEAGAVPLSAAETIRRGRLGPGELLLVDPARRLVLEDAEAKVEALRRSWVPDAPRPTFDDRRPTVPPAAPTPASIRYLAGLDAERYRLHVKTMTIEGREPLWSMGDDTPTPGRARIDRLVTDHLRQAFAQVTNPPIDPDRERAVLDLSVELGPRPSLLAGPPDAHRQGTIRLAVPFVADLDGLLTAFPGPLCRIDATWLRADGEAGLASALERLAHGALDAARAGAGLLVVTDRALSLTRPPVPSVLAVGAVHTALTAAGLRGRADIVADSGDVLDVHASAMVLAVGASTIHPWLAIELAGELAGSRGAEGLTPDEAVARLLGAFEGGLRKTLARMGISTVASYVGGALFETLELATDVLERCFPAAPSWPGTIGLRALARRSIRRADAAVHISAETRPNRLADPGLVRFRGDGELHLYRPAAIGEIQALARDGVDIESALLRYRAGLAREGAVVRDGLAVRPLGPSRDLTEVEPAAAIVRRFVASAMSVGALSPEAHQAVTIGIQRAGGTANTGEGGEDPAWYEPSPDGERRDARIKQVASARFGVTATYLARADQLEIKIAQGSKPGEGGQLPGRKATAFIAALRRGQAGQSYISPPPHHDIYSIEDLAQLIADLRAIGPSARIGVKLVASRGIGTIAAGVAKAGADYIHVAGHAGGTGASPLSSIRHAGAPWELGLAEVHQVLLRNDIRDRVVLRTDGGLQTGRDIVMAALLGAEEFALGTALLVALGCDMARQCHLDTCPTGIATQRDDLRAKFAGGPEHVERFVVALAEDVRRELAVLGAATIGEIVGEAGRSLRPIRAGRTLDLRPIIDMPRWGGAPRRRADPSMAAAILARAPASAVEHELVVKLAAGGTPDRPLAIGTGDRSFGAELSGALERGEIRPPIHLQLVGAAGQSLGAFLTAGISLHLTGVANDYVGKGLSGGSTVVVPEPDLAAPPDRQAIVGNTCLYGATSGRLHVIGRAGMRFAVRNSGAEAVVEGVGPHACEYMTGGVVVILGPVGRNLGAGMTGGRVYVLDPGARYITAFDGRSVSAVRLSIACGRDGGARLADELARLVADHAAVGSGIARRLLAAGIPTTDVWLVEPIATVVPTSAARIPLVPATVDGLRDPAAVGPRPDRNLLDPLPVPTVASGQPTV